MELATWILVIILSVVLLVFLILGIMLIVKLMDVADEAKNVIATGQQIANKADDIVGNVKDLTSVGGIVKTFTNRVISEQERKYAAQDAAREAAEAETAAAEKAAERAAWAEARAENAERMARAESREKAARAETETGKATKKVAKK